MTDRLPSNNNNSSKIMQQQVMHALQ